jgi:hypothetical protein
MQRISDIDRSAVRGCVGVTTVPYTAMTGGSAKIIASANCYTLPPQPDSGALFAITA